MSPGVRGDREEYVSLDLEVHAFLLDVPLRDVSVVDLPGGGDGRSLADLRELLSLESVAASSRIVGALFALRGFLGRGFRWDDGEGDLPAGSFLHRVSPEQRARSAQAPGTLADGFRTLYAYDQEAVSEIINATVHAFSCMVLRRSDSGYRFYWGIYVLPVSRWTPVYMAVIEPFRRFLVYPILLQRLRKSWISRYSAHP